MVMYNSPINTGTRLQSALGRQEEVYKELADKLVMATVVRVNYLYNTVDLMTVQNKEMIISGDKMSGRFSARIPSPYGGSFSDGNVYGNTTPINVGDEVLVGFIDSQSNSPIVLGVYKKDDVSYKLAPTDKATGDPEDPKLRQSVMEDFKLYPAQVYDWTDGFGNKEHTFNGRSFLKIATGLGGSAKPNDYGFQYDNLQRYHLRGKDVKPATEMTPQVLFQHTGVFSDTLTNVLFDEDENLSISKVYKEPADKTRAEIRLDSTDSVRFRTQKDSKRFSEDSKDFAEVGIKDGIPFFAKNTDKLELTEEGLLLNGKPVGAGGGTIPEGLEERITSLEESANSLLESVDYLEEEEVPGLKENIGNLNTEVNDLYADFITLRNTVDLINRDYGPFKRQVETNTNTITSLNLTISNASGSYASIGERLDAIEVISKRSELVIAEVVASRIEKDKDGNRVQEYTNLPERLNSMSIMLRKVVSDTNDIAEIRDNVSKLLSDMEEAQAGIHTLEGRVNRIIGSGEDEISTTYLVQVIPDGVTSFRDGVGSVTLEARVLRNGFDLSTSLDLDTMILWSRKSADKSADDTWNAQHNKTSRTLKVDADTVNGSAKFTATLVKQTEANKLNGFIVVENYNEAPNAEIALSSNLIPRQRYEKETNTYTPDFTVSPVKVTGSIVTAGGVIASPDTVYDIEWFLETSNEYRKIVPSDPEFSLDLDKKNSIEVYRNIQPDEGRFFLWMFATYKDPKSGVEAKLKADFGFELTSPNARSIFLDVYSRNGLLFLDSKPSYIILRADSYLNGSIDTEHEVRYKWFKQDPSVTSDKHPSYDISGGLGWAAIDVDRFPGLDPIDKFGSANKRGFADLRVTSEGVLNTQEFKIVSLSESEVLSRFISLSNFDSGYTISVVSKGGLLLKGDRDLTDLTAKVFNSRGEVDQDGSEFTYKWYIYDANGELVTGIGNNNLDYKEGKTVYVGRGEVTTDTFTTVVQVDNGK